MGRNDIRSLFLGCGCDEALLVKKGIFSEKGESHSLNEGLVRISTGKAIQ